MIPLKIISREEAIKAGLTKDFREDAGEGVTGASMVGKNEKDGSITLVEKTIIKKNGEIELIFMSKERKAYFKKKGNLKDYIKQFKKIPENVKKDID